MSDMRDEYAYDMLILDFEEAIRRYEERTGKEACQLRLELASLKEERDGS